MKSAVTIILSVVLLAVAIQLFRLYGQNLSLESDLSKINTELTGVSKENTVLEADLSYLAEAGNLAKELREKLNYKAPGEKLIIIVPPKTSD